ncbi:MAG: MFS transporter [Patescibacteria group bacterium]
MLQFSGKHSGHIFHIIFLLGFLFSIHAALPAYITSSFLSEVGSERAVGILYTIGSLLSIVTLLYAPVLLSRFGNYHTMLALSAIEAILLLGLAYFTSFAILATLFAISLPIILLLYFGFDVFIENNSPVNKIGGIRGGYLTVNNLAWLFSPMAVAIILTNGDYWKIYLISAVIMALVALLILGNLKNFKDPAYRRVRFMETFRRIKSHKNLRNIFATNTLLHFFYAWMVIYTPIYLHEHIGLPWSDIGIIFTIMLLPFVLFEFPAGKLADGKWGEKELLNIGIILIAVSTALLSFIAEANVALWALALFITRIGASIVEVMNDTYFFKQINASDADIISFFRNTRPLAYSIAPLIATVVLFVTDYRFLFLTLGAIMLSGLYFSLQLKDTR